MQYVMRTLPIVPEFAPCKGIEGNPRQTWTLNSTSWILDSSYCISVFVSRTWISIVSGLPDSL